MEKVKEIWDGLPAFRKRQVVLGVLGAAILFVFYQFVTGGETVERSSDDEEMSVRLTGGGARDLGIDALDARLRRIESEKEDLEAELEREIARREELEERRISDLEESHSQHISVLSNQLDQQMRILQRAGLADRSIEDIFQEFREEQPTTTAEQAVPVPQIPEDSEQPDREPEADRPDSEPEPQVSQPEPPAQQPQPSPGRNIWQDESSFQTESRPPEDGEDEAPTQTVSMSTITDEDRPAEEDADAAKEDEHVLHLTAGSILSGVLLTGLDAPTSATAQEQPHPALIRIQDEAILPNRFRSDIRECFALVGGYGSMSSERAYLRGETLSCISEDGEIFESGLSAYTVGEDGKAGVRGRLVSKQGAVVARSLQAGFMSGVAQAFDVNPVPRIRTNGGDTQEYERVMSSDAVQGAAVSGTSRALERIADYYLEMADQIFPVLEVDAGREVEMVVTNGFTIDFSEAYD